MPRHVPALDGVRALAIALVVASHAVMPGGFGGALGVDMFFVLSGYLITALLLAEHRAHGRFSIKRFYARRALRLLPPLVIVLAALAVPLGAVFGWGLAWQEILLALFYLMPLKVQTEGGGGPLGHTWSLGVEEWFYLVWPALLALLLFLGGRRRRSPAASLAPAAVLAAVAFGLLAVAARLADEELGRASYVFRSFGLMAGCLLALVLALRERSGRPLRVPAWAGVAGLVPVAAAVAWSSSHGPSTPAALLADAGTLLVVAAIAGGARLGILSSGPVAYLGRISYEVYLWHFPLFMLASHSTRSEFRDVAWAVVPASLALAALTHRVTAPWSQRLRARLRTPEREQRVPTAP